MAGLGQRRTADLRRRAARRATERAAKRPASAQSLTPQQLAGQRVIYSYTGLTPPSSLIQRIKAGEAAGVIFFGDNISSDTQISSVVQQLQQANAQSPVKEPLLLMTDQEGGEVRRLPGEPTQSEKQIGESSDPAGEASTAGTGGRAEPGQRRHEPQPRARAGRLPHGR